MYKIRQKAAWNNISECGSLQVYKDVEVYKESKQPPRHLTFWVPSVNGLLINDPLPPIQDKVVFSKRGKRISFYDCLCSPLSPSVHCNFIRSVFHGMMKWESCPSTRPPNVLSVILHPYIEVNFLGLWMKFEYTLSIGMIHWTCATLIASSSTIRVME